MLVIGLVGEKGGGKETVGTLIAQLASPRTVSTVRFSDTLADVLDILSLPRTRQNLQHLAVVIDQGFGVGTFTNAVRERLIKRTEDIVILDGIRWPTDLEMLRSIPGALLVYVTADARIRFDRLRARKEKAGEESASWEQFMAEEQAQNETYIPTIGAQADVRIDNIGTLDELRDRVRIIFETTITQRI